MYTKGQYLKALEVYDETGSVTQTITILGYPARRQTLYNWITRRKHVLEGYSTFRGLNTPEHPRHPSLSVKLEALHRCFELGEDVQSVSDEIGYSKASIYTWRKKYIQKGTVALMNPPNERLRGKLTEGSTFQRLCYYCETKGFLYNRLEHTLGARQLRRAYEKRHGTA
ncbi:MAG TPA: helix-turn-helix domain-containing protein [Candidatus Avimonas sp.]|nr:helix-turn-helix domain-containing protein [Candidatus Avimonas sp.]